jgi:hypothetical protein
MEGLLANSDAHRTELSDLCCKVKSLFQKIWPRATRHPSLTECYGIAVRINIVAIVPPPKKPSPPTALKHGRLFLQHLPVIRQTWEALEESCKIESNGKKIVINQEYLNNCKAMLSMIDQTERCVQTFLEKCTTTQSLDQNAAIFIADAVQMAWQTVVDNDRVPKSVGFNDPLCQFVTQAMAWAGKSRSSHTVSGMLRQRHLGHKRPKPS